MALNSPQKGLLLTVWELKEGRVSACCQLGIHAHGRDVNFLSHVPMDHHESHECGLGATNKLQQVHASLNVESVNDGVNLTWM